MVGVLPLPVLLGVHHTVLRGYYVHRVGHLGHSRCDRPRPVAAAAGSHLVDAGGRLRVLPRKVCGSPTLLSLGLVSILGLLAVGVETILLIRMTKCARMR